MLFRRYDSEVGGKVRIGRMRRAPFASAAATMTALAVAALLVSCGGSTVSSAPAGASSAETSAAVAHSEQDTSADPMGHETEAKVEPAASLTPEEQAIKSLDGWWQFGRPMEFDGYLYIHDGVTSFYTKDGQPEEGGRTYDPSDVVRFDNGLTNGDPGPGLFDGGPGYFFYGPNKGTYGSYMSDDDPNTLVSIQMDGKGYSGGYAYGRVDPPTWADQVEEQAAQAATQSDAQAGGKPDASEATNAAKPDKKQKFDQAAAEAKALEDATAAGKLIFTGYLEIVDTATRQEQVGYPNLNPTDKYNPTNAVLLLDEPVSVEGPNPDGGTASSRPTITREVESVLLTPHSYSNDEGAVLDPWWQYDGQTITVACSGVGYADDTSAILYHASAKNPQVIAPLTEESAAALEAASSNGDYVLADSATRAYTRSELEAMDNHTLFLARNEVFARHGAGFRTQELRDWFASKAWYSETIAAGTYGAEILNDIERDNVELMLSIEQERNSPYI